MAGQPIVYKGGRKLYGGAGTGVVRRILGSFAPAGSSSAEQLRYGTAQMSRGGEILAGMGGRNTREALMSELNYTVNPWTTAKDLRKGFTPEGLAKGLKRARGMKAAQEPMVDLFGGMGAASTGGATQAAATPMGSEAVTAMGREWGAKGGSAVEGELKGIKKLEKYAKGSGIGKMLLGLFIANAISGTIRNVAGAKMNANLAQIQSSAYTPENVYNAAARPQRAAEEQQIRAALVSRLMGGNAGDMLATGTTVI